MYAVIIIIIIAGLYCAGPLLAAQSCHCAILRARSSSHDQHNFFMPVMSVPTQQKPSAKRTGKRITFFRDQSIAMKETSQHPEGSYYVPGGPASDPGQSEAASTVTSNPEAPHMYLNSVIFSPDKGDQSRGHYQQTVPMKWAHQEPAQQQPSLSQQQRAASWNTMTNWGQNFANYIGGVNVTDSRTQNAFVKSMHEPSGLQPNQQPPNRAAEKQPPGPNPAGEAYRDAVKAQGLDWEQQQSQAFQETLKPGALNPQQHSTSHPGGSSDITPEPLEPSDLLPPILHPEPPTEPQNQSQTQLRRSRRLSKEGGAPSDNPFLSVSSDPAVPGGPQGSQNGACDIQAAPTGVIQSTRRKRRVSQEVNLETLAQKASEMESLPSHIAKESHHSWSPTQTGGMNTKRPRDDSLLPLVIPVSVPVRRQDPSSPDRDDSALASTWPPRPLNPQDFGRSDHKPSVIVTRRRSLRNSLSESSEQNGRSEGERDDDGKKSKRRPRPEPLFIPPPKPGLFIAPPMYSSITPYQSHLRSPVRLAENPFSIPPYTPPPILSPVREGSGLYFSTFLSSAAASAQGLPPPITPKSATRSLLRSMQDLMHLACTSVLCGGGTNQELAHHCLYECKGDIMAALSLLMLSNPVFPKSHYLAHYHYSGSDSWTAAERRQFNKGIAAYKKDFFMVQKQVITKSVAQCVEFYYTYKKHVKIGRGGMLIYGELEPLESKTTEEETDHKGSQRLEPQREEDSRKWEGSADRKQDVGPIRAPHTLQPADNPGTVLIMKASEDVGREQPLSRVGVPPLPQPPPPASKTRYDTNARKTSPPAANKASAGPEGEFPCKKCGRVFFKVKSRSAHMKSHAEQEKKAAALRQKEAEERAASEAAAAFAARQNGARQGGDSSNDESSGGEDKDDKDWK
ncbi:hypothetical protein F7725_008345 [Dissostichus mawsoni]|uniref:Uncharacterized protein n=1 Tax=Dissostichus mawsoni TaxID=36200 RepID=A0A7J5Y6X3_DISMA|nr:hypothetical protein F7725_008345 [Dissostichus mawsoni]